MCIHGKNGDVVEKCSARIAAEQAAGAMAAETGQDPEAVMALVEADAMAKMLGDMVQQAARADGVKADVTVMNLNDAVAGALGGDVEAIKALRKIAMSMPGGAEELDKINKASKAHNERQAQDPKAVADIGEAMTAWITNEMANLTKRGVKLLFMPGALTFSPDVIAHIDRAEAQTFLVKHVTNGVVVKADAPEAKPLTGTRQEQIRAAFAELDKSLGDEAKPGSGVMTCHVDSSGNLVTIRTLGEKFEAKTHVSVALKSKTANPS